MKVAIIHDWLTGMRGGERVLEVFCELFPDADLYTLFHIPDSVSKVIEDRTIKTSFIQRLPFATKKYRHYLPLFPLAIEGFDLKGYDLIISSSHCVAKGVIPPPDALHISYIHTPMRYVWDLYEDYFGRNRIGWFSKKVIGLCAHYLRMWDVTSSARVDCFVVNSNYVAKRVEKYYRRKAEVIYPPVDCSKFDLSEKVEDFYLIVSAFAPYKRIELSIETFNQLGLPLKIIGTGQDEKKLKRMAGRHIEFLGWKSNKELVYYYTECKALIFPGEEDFGIVPVEAMACGRPVIAYGKGGVLETVVPLNSSRFTVHSLQLEGESPTGIFFYEQTPESLIEAIRYFEKNIELFDKKKIREHALKFDCSIFKERIGKFIYEKYEEFINAQKT